MIKILFTATLFMTSFAFASSLRILSATKPQAVVTYKKTFTFQVTLDRRNIDESDIMSDSPVYVTRCTADQYIENSIEAAVLAQLPKNATIKSMGDHSLNIPDEVYMNASNCPVAHTFKRVIEFQISK